MVYSNYGNFYDTKWDNLDLKFELRVHVLKENSRAIV